MTSSSRPLPGRSGPNGPFVLAKKPKRLPPPVPGAPPLDGPLPGRLLVALSRLHRAETAPAAEAREES